MPMEYAESESAVLTAEQLELVLDLAMLSTLVAGFLVALAAGALSGVLPRLTLADADGLISLALFLMFFFTAPFILLVVVHLMFFGRTYRPSPPLDTEGG